jgi:hypothetical protein
MKKIEVESSMINWIGYDENTGELYVSFKPKGKVFIYWSVPFSFYEDLMAADSIGSYFNKNIKLEYSWRTAE